MNDFKWKDSYTWMIITILAVMFVLPITRPLFLWLMPLGRGFDDLIEIILIGFGLIVLASRTYIKWNKARTFRSINRNRNTKVKQVAWAVLGLVALQLSPFSADMWKAILYGKPLENTSFWIFLAVDLLIVIIGWNAFSFFDGRRKRK